MRATTGQTTGGYPLTGISATAAVTLSALADMLDPVTRARLTANGVHAGARCLEIGAGNGTIAAWLADLAGPDGEVIATDVHPDHVRTHPGVRVIQHDITREPLPAGTFDLIHARDLLQYLPEREQVLGRLADRLASGGVLLIEELEADWSTAVLDAPVGEVRQAQHLFTRYGDVLRSLFHNGDNDTSWCRRVNAAMRGLGLLDVVTASGQTSFPGGTGPGLLAWSVTTEQHDDLVAGGLTNGEIDALQDLALDPALWLRGILMVSTSGRRPT